MNRFVEIKKHLYIASGIIAILILFIVALLATMKKPRGLIIHPPTIPNSSQNAISNYNEPAYNKFLSLSPASFSTTFGVVPIVEKKIEKKVKPKPKIKKKIVKLPPKPKVKDLRTLGYRLTGLIMGENNDTLAFIYDPVARKNRVVRENASDSIQIIKAWMRKIEIKTPKGQGILELQNTKGVASNYSTGRNRSSMKSVSSLKTPNKGKVTPKPPQTPYRPTNMSDMLSSGELRPSYDRRNRSLGMAIRSVPSKLKNYGLRRGDVIVGTEQNQFRNMGDAKNVFRKIGQRPTILRVKRGNKTLFLTQPQKAHNKTRK